MVTAPVKSEHGAPAHPDPMKAIIEAASRAYGTVGEMVYAVLREAILSAALPNGAKLRQESLATMLGVSRIPVRSALIQLESDGLVVFTPRRGARVRSLSAETVEQIFDARVLVECHALRKSMEQMTPERAGRLAELATWLDDPGSGRTFRDELIDFYHQLYNGDQQPILIDIINRLRDNIGYQLVAQRIHGHQHTHRSLVSPVVAGDVDAAIECLLLHLASVKKSVLAHTSAQQ